MAIKTMSDYLSAVPADYTDETLSVTPQKVLPEDSIKKQVVHEADDKTIAVTSFANDSIFEIELQWDIISDEEAGIIMDLWNNSSKANGREWTFYWQHPTDNNIYTVRFLARLRRVKKAGRVGYQEVSTINLRVEGVRP